MPALQTEVDCVFPFPVSDSLTSARLPVNNFSRGSREGDRVSIIICDSCVGVGSGIQK